MAAEHWGVGLALIGIVGWQRRPGEERHVYCKCIRGVLAIAKLVEKATQTGTNAAFSLKADVAYTDNKLALTANQADLSVTNANKADISCVNQQIAIVGSGLPAD